MHHRQHAFSSLLTLVFGPRTDGRDRAPWGEILLWLGGFGLFGLLVYSVG